MTLSSLNITAYEMQEEAMKKAMKEARGIPIEKDGYTVGRIEQVDEEKLKAVKLAISEMERSVEMDGSMKEQAKPIRRLLDILEKDVTYSLELQRTLRDNLSPVLSQQPKVEKSGTVDEGIQASSTIFNDLESLSRQIKAHNSGLLELLEDLEI